MCLKKAQRNRYFESGGVYILLELELELEAKLRLKWHGRFMCFNLYSLVNYQIKLGVTTRVGARPRQISVQGRVMAFVNMGITIIISKLEPRISSPQVR